MRSAGRETGSLLVFLPGVGEIRRVAARWRRPWLPPTSRFIRSMAICRRRPGRGHRAGAPKDERKVVLATSIAETSLTIEGVRVVVDAGRMRRPAFDPVSGMTRLETVRVSAATAEQRRGRAGRLAPGSATGCGRNPNRPA